MPLSRKCSLFLLLIGICFCLSCTPKTKQTRLESIIIEVTGHNFNWHYRYPGADGILGTKDDESSIQDLYLPDNANIRLQLKSLDYVYTFALPDIGLKEIAVPDLDFELQFKTGSEQTLKVLGDQFCGYAHETLIGKAFVKNQDHGFYSWSN